MHQRTNSKLAINRGKAALVCILMTCFGVAIAPRVEAAGGSSEQSVLQGPIYAYCWAPPQTDEPFLVPMIRVNIASQQPSPEQAAMSSKRLADHHRAMLCWGAGKGLLTDPADALTAPDGSRVNSPSPWPRQGIAKVRHVISRYMTRYRKAGGKLDRVVLDFEQGISVWDPKRQQVFSAMANDPRFGGIARQLGFRDLSGLIKADTFHLSFRLSQADIRRVLKTDPQYVRFDEVMRKQVNQALNQAIADPVHAVFPKARISNYNDYDLTPPNFTLDLNGHPENRATRVGTTNSPELYGHVGQLSKRKLPSGKAYGNSPFAALRWKINTFRAIQRSSRAPIAPWICRADWSSSSLSFNHYYNELIYQLGAAGAADLLFWNPTKNHTAIQRLKDGNKDYLTNKLLSVLLVKLNHRLGKWERHPVSLKPLSWKTRVIATGIRLGQDHILWRVTVAPGVKAVRVKPTGDVLHFGAEPGCWYVSGKDQSDLTFEALLQKP